MGSSSAGSGARSPASTARGTSIESITSTSQSPGRDCSRMASAAPVPSYSRRFTRTSCASSKGSISAGSVWSHHTSALSSCAGRSLRQGERGQGGEAEGGHRASPCSVLRPTLNGLSFEVNAKFPLRGGLRGRAR